MTSNTLTSNSIYERVCVDFNPRNLELARKKSWEALQIISSNIKPGMNEIEAADLAIKLLAREGSQLSWHRPIVRFGQRTSMPYSVAPDRKCILNENDIFYIDIGPVWHEADGIAYEGDVGDSYVLGNNTDFLECIQTVRYLHKIASDYWRTNNPTGVNLYEWLSQKAHDCGYEIVLEDDGHRIGDFPHKRFCKLGLSSVECQIQPNLWILEVHIRKLNGHFGGFYEDILR